MRRHLKKKQGLLSSRKSVWFFTDMVNEDSILKRKSETYHNFKTNMLVEDTKSQCFPIPGYGKDYKVILDASDAKCENLIIDAIETRYGREDLENSLYEFFQTCVSVVMSYGYAAYEIVYFSNDEEKIESFGFTLIPPTAFFIETNKFKQYIPKEIVEERNLTAQYVDFTPEDILLFELPDDIKPYYNEMMESLIFLGQNLFPKFALENLRNPTIPFSHNDYMLSREFALAKATQKLGWNSRNYSSEYKFEYYVWHRQLKFYKFLCQLRDGILAKFNEGLERVGKQMRFQAKLSVEGLATIKDVDDAIERLKNGDLKTFSEVLDVFK